MEKIPSTPFKFICFAVKPYKKWFWWAVILICLAELSGIFQLYVFRGFVDAANSGASTRTVFLWVLAYPILNLIGAVAWRSVGFVMNFITIYTRTGAVKTLFEYLSLHSLSYFNDRFSGALSEKANIVSSNVSRLLTTLLNNILTFFIDIIVASIILYYSDANLAKMFLTGFAILIPLNLWLTRHQNVLSAKVVELAAKLRGQIIDTITNISAVQQYARRDYEIHRLDKAIVGYREDHVKRDNYREGVLGINSILIGIFVGVIVLWAFSLWNNQIITIGSLVLVVTLSNRFVYQLTFIGQNLNNIMEAYSEMQNGLKEIVRPHDITDNSGARRLN